MNWNSYSVASFRYATRILDQIDAKYPHMVNRKNPPRARAIFLMIITFLMVFTWAMDAVEGSHLWGCFVAGMVGLKKPP